MRHAVQRGLSVVAVATAAAGIGAVAAAPAAHAASLPSVGLPDCGGATKHVFLPDLYFMLPSTGNNNFEYSCVMGSGNVSNAVLKLQQALNRCYGAGIAEDQNFGPQTYNALRDVQRREGVVADGVYGPETATHILWPTYESPANTLYMCVRYPNMILPG
ncbi:MAG TPA: peptidoglycan-binding domain-containing protein [Candidatus Limnocylindria bacterium]|nr:peptidoglycan-binding domain-containing protein [Candidatus Limnocylindria bacterium]